VIAVLDKRQDNTNRSSWGIREFADMFDVTPRTIRFYEDKGLLTPARNAGARVFNAEDYVRFERIMRAKRIGFTLDDIKEVLDVTDGHITDRVELLRRKKNFEMVIRTLKRRRIVKVYSTLLRLTKLNLNKQWLMITQPK